MSVAGWIITAEIVIFGPILFLLIWVSWAKKRWSNRNLKPVGEGMAKKRGTWELEYGLGRNSERFSGYDRTTTVRMIAGTHGEAVALLKEYDPNFDPQHIVKSQRGGIEYIVAEKHA